MTASTPADTPPDPTWLAALARVSSVLNRAAAILAAAVLVAMISLILVEIGLRLNSRSTHMTDVLVGYGVACITFLAMAWALETSAMIRVGIVRRMAAAPLKWGMEMFSALGTLAIFLLFIVYVFRSMARNFANGTLSQHYLQIPLWIPDAVFFTGLALASLHLLVRVLRLLAVGLVPEPELDL